MHDREKVIRGLECCTAHECGKNCPYHDIDTGCRTDMEIDALALLKEHDDLGTELTNAVELIHKKNERIEKLLKEQEAVVPRRDANCVRMFRCGACGEYVGFIDSDPGDPNEQDNYCRNCGRSVKWE